MPDDYWIVNAIGKRLAMILQREFGGELLPLAKCTALEHEQRNREIQAGIRRGQSIRALAQRYELTSSRVHQIIMGDYGRFRRTGNGARGRRPAATRLPEKQGVFSWLS
ncbi:MAG TPA: Mor transcription activator family protein [Chthoniobacteraceae bacterium]|nr:Mor transcription activator family protein [Chthoniobacteraceae bacterium]